MHHTRAHGKSSNMFLYHLRLSVSSPSQRGGQLTTSANCIQDIWRSLRTLYSYWSMGRLTSQWLEAGGKGLH